MSEPFTSSSLKTRLKYGGNFQTTVDRRHEVKYPPVEHSLVWTVVEYLQKRTPSQVEHKLRINAKLFREPKAASIVLAILPKLLAQSDQHPVQPSKHIWRIANLRLEYSNPCHQDRRSLLVKQVANHRRARLHKVACDRRDPQSELAGRMLIVCDELDESTLVRRHRGGSRTRR